MSDLQARLEEKTARVAVVGQGYVGLPLAVEFARARFRVTGLDTDPARVAALNRGESYIPDVPAALLADVVQAGHFDATTDSGRLAEQDAIVICVPTPLRKSREPDVSHVVAAAEAVAARLRPGQLVVLESTTYPGTTEELLLPMFERGGLQVGRDFHLAFSPERIDPGNPQFGVKDIPKLVGGVTPACTRLAACLYRQVVALVHELSGPKVAELAKLYENTFRSVNIALANEMALVCHHLGTDVWEVIDAAATKPFGFMPFYPGPGIGGHCIPIDPFYLTWKAREYDFSTRFIELAGEVNNNMPYFCRSLISQALNHGAQKSVSGSKVLILGVAYKPDIGDWRESPAEKLIHLLEGAGAAVSYHDPFVPQFDGRSSVPLDPASYDCVAIVTNHSGIDYAKLVRESNVVVDFRNATKGHEAEKVWKL